MKKLKFKLIICMLLCGALSVALCIYLTRKKIYTDSVVDVLPTPIAEMIEPTIVPLIHPAKEIDISIDTMDGSVLLDQQIETFSSVKTSLTIQAEENIGYLYIKWHKPPSTYEISDGTDTKIGGEHGYLHELLSVDQDTQSITFYFDAPNQMADIYVYGQGSLPQGVQDWQPPYEQCDILAFPTHSDDDTLYMGTLISQYANEHKTVQIAYLINHWNTVERPHELLDGMWAMGVTSYPIISEFDDYYSDSLMHAQSIYDTNEMLAYQVEVIRRCKPTIIVGHDENGEYGHGVHQLNTYLLKQAILLASDETQFSESSMMYGTHAISKLYLHLYPEHQIILDVHKTLENGKTPFMLAQEGFSMHKSQHGWNLEVTETKPKEDCRLFGLYYSTVGYEPTDIFANIE